MRQGVVLLAAILVGVLTGCAAPDGSVTYTGFHRDGESLDIQNLTIPDGRYRIGYTVRVQLLSRDPEAAVRCGIVDSNATIEYLEQTLTEAHAGDGWVTLAYEDVYELPEITLGLRCAPTTEGIFTLRVADATLTALPTADYR